MVLRQAIGVGVMTAGLFIAAAAMAQPADFSQGEIPDLPLVLRTPGQPDRPLPAVTMADAVVWWTSHDGKIVY